MMRLAVATILAFGVASFSAEAEPVGPVYNISVEVNAGDKIVGDLSFNAEQGRAATMETGGPAGLRVEALVEHLDSGDLLSMEISLMRDGKLEQVAAPRITMVEGRGVSFSSQSQDLSISVAAAPVH
jgi:hypothetical protein